jgi:CO dehydrogenase/acetyl-CoA synthase beta subunit
LRTGGGGSLEEEEEEVREEEEEEVREEEEEAEELLALFLFSIELATLPALLLVLQLASTTPAVRVVLPGK